MGDQKFQLRYSASEDRVLIISGTGADDMRCFALTRRMVRQLWPGLNRVVATLSPRTRSAGPAVPPPPVAGADRVATPVADPATADPSTSAAPPPVRPDAPGENPFGAPPPTEARHLVRKLQLIDRGERTRQLVLTAADAELRVPLDKRQLAQIYEALRLVIERADWGIDLDAGLPDPAVGTAEPAARAADTSIDITAESPSRYRH